MSAEEMLWLIARYSAALTEVAAAVNEEAASAAHAERLAAMARLQYHVRQAKAERGVPLKPTATVEDMYANLLRRFGGCAYGTKDLFRTDLGSDGRGRPAGPPPGG